MPHPAMKRVQRELAKIIEENKTDTSVTFGLVNDDNVFDLHGEITGPPETPYEGGKFQLKIEIPQNYPVSPPKIAFITPIWHPNVLSSSGYICFNGLNSKWNMSMSIANTLHSIRQLLCEPITDDPLDLTVSDMLEKDKDLFNETAKYWTKLYANGPGDAKPEFEILMKKILDMGFSQITALRFLSKNFWKIDSAIEEILDPETPIY